MDGGFIFGGGYINGGLHLWEVRSPDRPGSREFRIEFCIENIKILSLDTSWSTLTLNDVV